MKRLPRKWIEDKLNAGLPVQVACTYSNVCRWNYLTTSGQVTREEYGFEDDILDEPETHDLPVMTWSSVKRLQNCLQRMAY